jgi:hypothetical protein
MNIHPVYISALQAFGYTDAEARFLYLVATHSGYFLARHFLAFAGARWGKRTDVFWHKLESNGHARRGSLSGRRAVYHVFGHTIYRALDREHLGNHRRHERQYIETRLAILDFVLANQELCYLETEADKLAFFCRDCKIEPRFLPSKTYLGSHTVQPTVRYFLDRYPMFLSGPASPPPVVTLSFIQGSEASLLALVHHLQVHRPLFRELSEFHFLYLARTEVHFTKARELFHALVTVPLQANPADDLLRYFTIRKAWDLHQYGAVSEADLVYRNIAKDRFHGERFEHYYHAWKSNRISDAHIRDAFQGHSRPHATHFEARILKPFAPPDIENGGAHGLRRTDRMPVVESIDKETPCP